jgi:mannosyltransferase OCH1-like enzyme
VSDCLASWDKLRADGLEFEMFDDESAGVYIRRNVGARQAAAFAKCWHPAMRSDYFRLCYLLVDGGLYVDADDVLLGNDWVRAFLGSTLKVQALCYDLSTNAMVDSRELRRADLAREGRIFYVNNNPIATAPGHPIVRRAVRRATNRLLGSESVRDIQSTTGPGNLTAALAAHANELRARGGECDFEILLDWDVTASPRWDLGYRDDDRNWRRVTSQGDEQGEVPA